MLTKFGKQMSYEDLRIMVNEEQTRRGGGLKSFFCSLALAWILSISIPVFNIKGAFMALRIPFLVIVAVVTLSAWFYNVYMKHKINTLIEKTGNEIVKAKAAVVAQVESERQKSTQGEE